MRSARLTSAAALFLGGAGLLLFGSHDGAAAMGLPRPVAPLTPLAPFAPFDPAANLMADPAANPGGRLIVTYDEGDAHPHTYTLTCGESEQAADAAACDRLRRLGGPLDAVPEGQMCSMIYGGPQTASVIGVWNGQPRAETYRRTNGCEVARWSRMVPALPNPTTTETHGPITG